MTDLRHPEAEDTDSSRLTRKNFLKRMAVGSWFMALCLAFFGALRSAVPSVLPDPVRRFKIGKAHNFTPGLAKEFPKENVIVYCDDEGLYAISTLCTHLGCVVRSTSDGFHCPCHGSRFAADGEVTRGPAPRGLEWYAIEKLAGGQMVVDRARPVRRGTKVRTDTPDA